MSELVLAAGMMAAPNIRLERVLREGGMGSVWVAEHLSLKTRVAVKFMLLQQSKSEEATTRFSREASAAAQIKSPHVVQVFDHGVNEHGMAYIVMELLEGEDLGTRLARRGALPLNEVTAIITQAAKAMSKAHMSGVVHRDIKPDNIFIMDVDGELFVKVLDFGVAKTTVEKAMNMTSTGVMMGTPFYMAPEQMANAKNAVPQSDLWSLGVVAYEAMTGKLPFQGETVAGLAIAVERGKFEPASQLVPTLPKSIDGWFNRVLLREPEKRFATARELGDELNLITNPHARRPMPSELTTSQAGALPIVVLDANRPRLPTEMGATLDGVPKSRKRNIAVVGLVAAVVIVAGIGVVALKGRGSSPAAAAEPTAAPKTEPLGITATATASTMTVASSDATPTSTAATPPAPSASASAKPVESTFGRPPTVPPTWKPNQVPAGIPTHKSHGI